MLLKQCGGGWVWRPSLLLVPSIDAVLSIFVCFNKGFHFTHTQNMDYNCLALDYGWQVLQEVSTLSLVELFERTYSVTTRLWGTPRDVRHWLGCIAGLIVIILSKPGLLSSRQVLTLAEDHSVRSAIVGVVFIKCGQENENGTQYCCPCSYLVLRFSFFLF